MKKALFLALALLLVSSMAWAAGTVVGSHHDLSTGGGITDKSTNETQVCIFCHTPHNAYVDPAQKGTANNTYPLWNHQLSTFANYGIYMSDTMNTTPTGFGGGTASKSALCMSCHDGSVAVNSLYNYSSIGVPTMGSGNELDATGHLTSSANIGTDLSNDHPVNFTYQNSITGGDTGLQPAATVATNTPLFQGTVQCASCHAVHDPTNVPFLRMPIAASALCRNCHIK